MWLIHRLIYHLTQWQTDWLIEWWSDFLFLQTGAIIRSADTFIIAPIPREILETKQHSESHGAHIIYRRSALPESHPGKRFSCGSKSKKLWCLISLLCCEYGFREIPGQFSIGRVFLTEIIPFKSACYAKTVWFV